MSNNQLNDISKVYLSQVAEETPGERIDRKSQEGVAKRKAAASSEKEDRVKKAGEFQKHKQSILAKGGRHVDALDSWHKKQAYERNAKTRSEALMSTEELKEKEDYKTVAAVIDYDRSKKGTDDAVYDTEHGKKKQAKKERDYAAWERSKMKKDDPNWKHKKYSTSEDKDWGYDEKGNSLNPKDRLQKVKKEALSDWRIDLSDIIEAGPLTASPSLSQDNVMRDNQNLDQVPAKKKRMTQDEFEKEVTEKNIKNKVIINPTFQESIREIGGEVLEAVETEVDEDYDLVQKQRRQDAEARKHVARKETRKKVFSKVKNVVKGFLGKEETEVDEYLETVSKVKRAENVADKERWAVDEAVKGEDTQDRKDAAAERRSGTVGGVKTPKRLSPSKGRGYVTGTKASIDWWKDHNKKKDNVEEQVNSGDNKEDPAAAEEQDKQLQSKQKRISQMKKMVLLQKMKAVRSGAGAEITASYDPEGQVIDETLMSVKAATYGMPNEKRKAIIDKYKRSEENRGTDKKKGRDAGAIARERLNKEETIIERPLTGYEDKKKEEVITALKKKKPEFKKRYGKDAADVMYAVATNTAKKKGDTSKSDDRYAYEEIEFAVDYFYEQGINEDGLDLIIEEIGLDAFVEFVLNPSEELMEERAARKMNVRTKKKMPAIVASDAEAEAKRRAGKTGEYKETPKKKARVGGPSYTTTVKSEPKKKEAPKPVAKPVVKKVEKAVVKVKPTQPKKEVSKGGLRDRISGAVEAGVKRHKKAVQPARVFAKGVKAGVKSTVKFAGKAKKAIVGEEVIDEGKCEDCGCKGCGKNPCVECGEDHHKLGEETKSVEKKKKETLQKIKKDARDILKQDEIHSKIEEAKVDAGKTPHEKETIRNQRNTPPGANTKFDTSVFITRKSGESPISARGRKRREAHAKRRGVKEDKAFDNVVSMLRKKHGEGSVITKDSPKPKASSQPKRKPEKDKRSAAQREVDAQYGRTPWNKKGSLGT